MVALVLVSHSKKLALAVRHLLRPMADPQLRVAIASGTGEGHKQLGTDAVFISSVLRKACKPDGALVLMDLGSAVLSAETALELLDEDLRHRIRLCPGAMIEGAVAAAVQASAGGDLDQVYREAQQALRAKEQQLNAPAEPSGAIVASAAQDDAASEIVLAIDHQHGLHARPAAMLIRALSKYQAEIEVTNETMGRGPASARSLTSLALLQVEKGHRIRVRARGVERVAALAEVSALAAKRFGESGSVTVPPAAIKLEIRTAHRGVAAADGIAIGPLVVLDAVPLPVPQTPGRDSAAELRKLTSAITKIRSSLPPTAGSADESQEILNAHALILDDPVLLEKVRVALETKHENAARAWMEATGELSELYEAMGDPYLRARAADVRDMARRVLQELLGKDLPAAIRLEQPAILYTRELSASEAAALDGTQVLGVIARDGSLTAHSAIIVRTRGIPMVVGVDWLDCAKNGQTVAMDGATGQVWLAPDDQVLAMLTELQQARRAHLEKAGEARRRPSVTLDGVRMEVMANVGNRGDAAVAADNGAEGVGLLRSESLFLSRTKAPTEQEQSDALHQIFDAIPGTIVVRTLDVGADKPLAFLPPLVEKNPFLGVRGVRLALQHREFFLTHLRAILSAAAGRDVWLVLPMVSVTEEIKQTRALLEEAHAQLESNGRIHLWPIRVGAMVEVPSAALMAEQLAAEAEFFSIGTNDLTQYVMAVERGSASLPGLQDALHPAVLRIIKTVVEGAGSRVRHVSVCGDAASDLQAAALFAGLGVRSLSVRPGQVAEIKALFRELSISDLQWLASEALQCVDAAQVRALARQRLSVAGDLPGLR